MLSLNTVVALKNLLRSDRFSLKGNERGAFNQLEAELATEEKRLREEAKDKKGGEKGDGST